MGEYCERIHKFLHTIYIVMNRDVSLDIMKGIAIIAVVFGHCVLFPYHTFIYSFHMPLFFIVAGYLYKKKAISYSLKKDVSRLVLPYIVFSLIRALKFTITKVIENDWSYVKSVWMEMLYGNECSIYGEIKIHSTILWFLLALFVCKNFFNILNNIIKLKRNLYIIVGGASLFFTICANYIIILPWGLSTGGSAMMFYMIGNIAKNRNFSRYAIVPLILLWWIGIAYSQIDMMKCHYIFYPVDVLGACGATWLIYIVSKWISQRDSIVNVWLSWMGRYSLIVLCMHFMVQLLDLNTRINTNSWVLYLLIDFAQIIPLTYICTKIKVTKLLFQV